MCAPAVAAGGVAYVNVFGRADNTYYQPALVFTKVCWGAADTFHTTFAAAGQLLCLPDSPLLTTLSAAMLSQQSLALLDALCSCKSVVAWTCKACSHPAASCQTCPEGCSNAHKYATCDYAQSCMPPYTQPSLRKQPQERSRTSLMLTVVHLSSLPCVDASAEPRGCAQEHLGSYLAR